MTDIRSGVPRPDFERDVLISQLRQAYLGLMEARETLGPGAGLQRASEAVIGELEALALVLTGDGQYFRRDRSHKGAGGLDRRDLDKGGARDAVDRSGSAMRAGQKLIGVPGEGAIV
ncbi:hypothetical protein [Roseibium aestuarii]|uniref:Uncharacterized protein n=1 Tax=Roseibium aestuarii TaxID=2600299 RepID=A0ABW4JSK5_9HYPH|nr:hypothetical protein [Roseibium aestuarii]